MNDDRAQGFELTSWALQDIFVPEDQTNDDNDQPLEPSEESS